MYICVNTCIYMCTYMYSWRKYLHEFKRNDYTYTQVMVGTVHMLSNYICVHIFIYVCTYMYIWREYIHKFKMNKFAYTPVVVGTVHMLSKYIRTCRYGGNTCMNLKRMKIHTRRWL